MATAIGNLIIRVGGQTGGAQRAMLRLQGMVATTGRMVRSLAAAFVPLAIGAGFAGMLRAGERFNRAMRNSLAIMGDVSEETQQRMRDAAFETAKLTGGAVDLANAYYYLGSAGMDTEQQIAALPQAAKFALAGQFDLKRATELAGDAMAVMGLKSSDAQQNLKNLTRVTDVLVKANTLAQASTEQFAEALTSRAGKAFQLLDRSLEEAVATLAVLAENGIKGAEAGTTMDRMLTGLQSNAINNAAAFQKLGIAVYDDMGQFRSLKDIVQDLERALLPLAHAERQAAIESLGFTKKNASLVRVMLAGSDQAARFEKILRKAGGTTAEVAAKQLTPLQRGWSTLSATLVEAGSKIMLWLGPKLETAMKWTANAVDGMRVAFAALLPVWQIIGTSVSELAGLIVDCFKLAWNYIAGLFAPLQTNFAEAFRTIVSYLDVMLGSVEGWRHGVVMVFKQTCLAIQAGWEFAIHFLSEKLVQLAGIAATTWENIKEGSIRTFTPLFAKLWIAYDKTMAKIEGRKWMLTPEEEEAAIYGTIDQVCRKIGEKRRQIEQQTNKRIQDLRAIHEKELAAIGEKSIKETERWEQLMGKLPKLSTRFAEAWEALLAPKAPEMPAGPEMPELPGGGEMGGGAIETRAAEPQFAAAALKGSQEAWHNIVMAMGAAQDVPAARTADNTAAMREEEKRQTALLQEAKDAWKTLAGKAGFAEKGQELAAKTAASIALVAKEATLQTRHLSNLLAKIQVGELISVPDS